MGHPNIPEWLPTDENHSNGLTILPDELKIGTIEECSRCSELWENIYEEAGVKFC